MRYFLHYVPLVLWAALIFYFSSEGSDSSSGRSDAIVEVIRAVGASWPQELLTFLTRKAAHIIAYFILGILAFFAIRQHGLPVRRTILLSIGFVVVYAISDEIHQLFVPGRSGEVRDVLIDSVAGTVGVAAMYALTYWRVKKHHKD